MFKGSQDVMDSAWFRPINFVELYNKEVNMYTPYGHIVTSLDIILTKGFWPAAVTINPYSLWHRGSIALSRICCDENLVGFGNTGATFSKFANS